MQKINSLYLANVQDLISSNDDSHSPYNDIYKKVLHTNVSLVDRTEKIVMPYKFQLYSDFKMPTDLTNFNMSYTDCLLERAEELYSLSVKLKVPLKIYYSGGIDSTLILVSFLMIQEKKNIKENIIVSMSPESIRENPNFYYQHILPNFKLESSENFSNDFDKKCIIVGGEFNDQLFGSIAIYKVYAASWDFSSVLKSYNSGLVRDFFLSKGMSEKSANWWYDMLIYQAETAPCKIQSTFDLLWWFNFNFKWQSVLFRIVLRVSKEQRVNIDDNFMKNYFHHFYTTTNFQKWSMLNSHLKVKEDWKSYKYICKEIIYNYTKDEYWFNNKIKVGSLFKIFLNKNTPQGLDTNYNFLFKLSASDYYNQNNSFINGYK